MVILRDGDKVSQSNCVTYAFTSTLALLHLFPSKFYNLTLSINMARPSPDGEFLYPTEKDATYNFKGQLNVS